MSHAKPTPRAPVDVTAKPLHQLGVSAAAWEAQPLARQRELGTGEGLGAFWPRYETAGQFLFMELGDGCGWVLYVGPLQPFDGEHAGNAGAESRVQATDLALQRQDSLGDDALAGGQQRAASRQA